LASPDAVSVAALTSSSSADMATVFGASKASVTSLAADSIERPLTAIPPKFILAEATSSRTDTSSGTLRPS
jgi:hypothetical protein